MKNRILDHLAEREIRELGRAQIVADRPTRLVLGPMNTAGQAYEWARAVERFDDAVAAAAVVAQKNARRQDFRFANDVQVGTVAQRGNLAPYRERVLDRATHVLFESCRPLLGNFWNGSMLDDLPALAERGATAAVILHGSEARDLVTHRGAYASSPFDNLEDPYFAALQAEVTRTRELLARFAGPIFVSTPDLLDFVPGSVWLPLVIDVDRFAGSRPALEREIPVVLHTPSNPRLKGTMVVEPVLEGLQRSGRIVYRRLVGVNHDDMPGVVRDADIVVDQVVLGNPGVLLAETLAAGRLAVAHVAPHVRSRMGTGLPVVEADATTFATVMEEILEDRDHFAEIAAGGPEWARTLHGGHRAAAALAPFLGITT